MTPSSLNARNMERCASDVPEEAHRTMPDEPMICLACGAPCFDADPQGQPVFVPLTALSHERQLREEAERERDKARAGEAKALEAWRKANNALGAETDRILTAEHQLHEARTQVTELEEERDKLQAALDMPVHDRLSILTTRAESAETQLKRCQEALRRCATGLEWSYAYLPAADLAVRRKQGAGDGHTPIADPIYSREDAVRDAEKARSLSQQPSPNTPETK